MPIPVLKSFAQKSGKSLEEVEKIYQEIKTSAKDPEDYKYIIGSLKKILKLNEGNTMSTFAQYIKTLTEETTTGDIASVESKLGKIVKRPKKVNEEGKEIDHTEGSQEDLERKEEEEIHSDEKKKTKAPQENVKKNIEDLDGNEFTS